MPQASPGTSSELGGETFTRLLARATKDTGLSEAITSLLDQVDTDGTWAQAAEYESLIAFAVIAAQRTSVQALSVASVSQIGERFSPHGDTMSGAATVQCGHWPIFQ
jgi:hypothetical protein